LREFNHKLQKKGATMPESQNTTTTKTIADIVGTLSAEELLAAIRGEVPAVFAGLPVVDFNEIDPADDFESPGLHKRARAGIGAILSRSRDNVHLRWNAVRVAAPAGYYSDSDRKVVAVVETQDSTWGSQRGCTLVVIDGWHTTGGGVNDDCLLYEPLRGLFGVVTDSEGVASCLVRMEVPNPDWRVPTRDPLHQEVNRIWDSLSGWLRSQVLEEALSRLD
jgi:hypothetical protein